MDFSSFTPILKQSWALWKPWPNLRSVFIFISHFFRCISQKQSWVREEHQLKLHRTTWKLTAKPQSLFNHNEMFLDPKWNIMTQGAAQDALIPLQTTFWPSFLLGKIIHSVQACRSGIAHHMLSVVHHLGTGFWLLQTILINWAATNRHFPKKNLVIKSWKWKLGLLRQAEKKSEDDWLCNHLKWRETEPERLFHFPVQKEKSRAETWASSQRHEAAAC